MASDLPATPMLHKTQNPGEKSVFSVSTHKGPSYQASPNNSQAGVHQVNVPNNSMAAVINNTAVQKYVYKPPRIPQNFQQLLRESIGGIETVKDSDLQIEKKKTSGLHSVDIFYGLLITLANIYFFFACFFYIGILDPLCNTELAFELSAEIFLLIDSIIVVLLLKKFPVLYQNLVSVKFSMWTKKAWLNCILRWISSLPVMLICVIFQVDRNSLTSQSIYYLRLFHLIRTSDIFEFINRMVPEIKASFRPYVQIGKYILIIIMVAHMMSMLWLMCIRSQDSSSNTWAILFNLEKATILELYFSALFFVTTNMTGMCYGDTYPVTTLERLFYCFILFSGCTVFAGLFGSFAKTVYMSTAQLIKEKRKAEQVQSFAVSRRFPQEFTERVLKYFTDLQAENTKYRQYFELLQELPSSLRSKVAMNVNREFINEVRLFHISGQPFIKDIIPYMKPMICLAGDYIVRKGEVVENLYFIKKGITKDVCADDESRIIAYMGKGSFFGEIAILKTGKQLTSILAYTNCLLYSINFETLQPLLEKYPQARAYLDAVAEERMGTINSEDLIDNSKSVSVTPYEVSGGDAMAHKLEQSITFEQTKLYAFFMFLLFLAISYNILYTFYAISYEDLLFMGSSTIIALEVIAYLIYVADIPIKYVISKARNASVQTEQYPVFFDFSLAIDILVLLPLDYPIPFLYFRLIRTIKLYRFSEINLAILPRLKNIHLGNIICLSLAYIYGVHIFACFIYSLAAEEEERLKNTNQKYMFSTVVFAYSSFKPVMSSPMEERYVHCLYLSISIFSSNVLGDIVPSSPFEQLLACLLTLMAKVFMVFLYSEVSDLVSSYYSAYIKHIMKTKHIVKWLQIHDCPNTIIKRVITYRDFLWRKYKGTDDASLIMAMPVTLQYRTKYLILEQLVKNSDAIPKDEDGAIISIIKSANIMLYPKGEFIIRDGEIGDEMYFLIEGTVEIFGGNGVSFGKLSPGKCFGEMALISENCQIRKANVVAITNISVAVLKKADFTWICSAYPSFNKKIIEITEERNNKNVKFDHLAERTLPRASSIDGFATTKKTLKEELKTSERKKVEEKVQQQIVQNENTLKAQSIKKEDIAPQQSHSKKRIWKFIKRIIQSLACLYNIIFIPLQMAFRMKYTVAIYFVESFVMAVHLFDIISVFRKAKNQRSQRESMYSEETSKKLPFYKKLVLEIITFIPFSIILQKVFYPTYVIAIIKCIRLLKFWHFRKFLLRLKKYWVNLIRLSEVILIYLLVFHVTTCLLILMIYVPDNLNDSFFKRIPYPDTDNKAGGDPNNYRKGNDWGTVSNFDVYVHFMLNDMNATNIKERIVIFLYQIICLYFLVFLFANITSMIIDFARGFYANLHKKYKDLRRSLKNKMLTERLTRNVEDYFNYIWNVDKGIEDNFLEKLPDSIRNDILMHVYKNALEKCYLLNAEEGGECHFDAKKAASFVRMMTVRKYLAGDIAIKVGSFSRKLILVLEGEFKVINYTGKVVGIAHAGFFYNTCFQDTKIKRSAAYFIASQISIVAILSASKLDKLLNAFPDMTVMLRKNNEIVFEKIFQSLDEEYENIEEWIHREYTTVTEDKTRKLCQKAQENSPGETKLNFLVKSKQDFGDQSKAKNIRNKGVERAKTVIKQQTRIKKQKEIPKFFLQPTMSGYHTIYFLHLINIVSTLITLPLQISLDVENRWEYVIIEVIEILESIIHVCIRLRTAALIKGSHLSYEFDDVFRAYRENGFWADLFGISPMNLIVGLLNADWPSWISIPAQLLRLGQVWNINNILNQIQIKHFKFTFLIDILSILGCYFLLWHWMASIWLFISTHIEASEPITWAKVMKLQNERISTIYLVSLYHTIKLVSGVPSGDSASATDLERACSFIFLRLGDIIFAVIFGLLAGRLETMASKLDNFLIKSYKVDKLTNAFKLSSKNRGLVDLFYSFTSSQKFQNNIFDEIKNILPIQLAKDISYEINSDLLNPMFNKFAPYPFIKKISLLLESEYYLPGDYIIRKNTVGDSMFFLVKGRVAIVASDKMTVLNRLYSGSYFGEIAIFIENKRVCDVRAETCCAICKLDKSVINNMNIRFPEVAAKMKAIGEQRLKEFHAKDKKDDLEENNEEHPEEKKPEEEEPLKKEGENSWEDEDLGENASEIPDERNEKDNMKRMNNIDEDEEKKHPLAIHRSTKKQASSLKTIVININKSSSANIAERNPENIEHTPPNTDRKLLSPKPRSSQDLKLPNVIRKESKLDNALIEPLSSKISKDEDEPAAVKLFEAIRKTNELTIENPNSESVPVPHGKTSWWGLARKEAKKAMLKKRISQIFFKKGQKNSGLQRISQAGVPNENEQAISEEDKNNEEDES